MLLGARKLGVPLLIGSCGTAGADVHLGIVHGIVREIAGEEGLSFKLALIHAEQDKTYLKSRLADGRISPLKPAPEISDAVIDRCRRVVGLLGRSEEHTSELP